MVVLMPQRESGACQRGPRPYRPHLFTVSSSPAPLTRVCCAQGRVGGRGVGACVCVWWARAANRESRARCQARAVLLQDARPNLVRLYWIDSGQIVPAHDAAAGRARQVRNGVHPRIEHVLLALPLRRVDGVPVQVRATVAPSKVLRTTNEEAVAAAERHKEDRRRDGQLGSTTQQTHRPPGHSTMARATAAPSVAVR